MKNLRRRVQVSHDLLNGIKEHDFVSSILDDLLEQADAQKSQKPDVVGQHENTGV